VSSGINPDPWQTDTSLGDWFYNKNWKYRQADWVIRTLVDIVSKNGNLLLNVVQRPDGSIDPEVEEALGQIADWMAINDEAIHGTRPWLTYGEGPMKPEGGHFKEDFAYSAKDIRFTTKGEQTLYAIALDWPSDGQLTIQSLAKSDGDVNKIADVRLLGCKDDIEWKQTADGLAVKFPARKPCNVAYALKITGSCLKPVAAKQAPLPGKNK
jgi:alpha-L-fucosidase